MNPAYRAVADACAVYGVKVAEVATELKPHQQRVLEKLRASGGVLVAHGLGSGKTLTSIAAIDQLGLPADVVTPAPLVPNYQKEIAKHAPGGLPGPVRIRSYQKAVRDKDLDATGLVVLDEAHKGRNTSSSINQEVLRRAQQARARLLLTGTPVFNDPADAAVMLNTAAGYQVLPQDPGAFKSRFVGEKVVMPSLWQRLRGVQPGTIPVLKNKEDLVRAATGYVDVHRGGTEGFPNRKDEVVEVPMTEKQLEVYKFHEGAVPWHIRAKIRSGLPLTKAESRDLNVFQGAMRQTANSPRPYIAHWTDEDEDKNIPKIQRAVEEIVKRRAQDPNFRAVMYSNYLGGGLEPAARLLQKAGIPHHLFTGSVPNKERARMIQEYNEGKAPVLLLSSAGSEGLDLKGTKLLQVLEPHWNQSKIDQVIGRGIRYKSHEHLPENEREVLVQRYFSTMPDTLATKLRLAKKPQTIEQYLHARSGDKDLLAKQLMEAFEEASARGPLQRPQDNQR